MKYKRFGEDIVARLEVGEEVIASLRDIAEKEGLTFASVSGIGAADDIAVSVYDVGAKRYFDNEHREPMEITSILGTVSEMDGEPYIHIHLTAGRADGTVIGGHLKRAVISATCELVLHTVYGRVPRFYDERTGLNLMEL